MTAASLVLCGSVGLVALLGVFLLLASAEDPARCIPGVHGVVVEQVNAASSCSMTAAARTSSCPAESFLSAPTTRAG